MQSCLQYNAFRNQYSRESDVSPTFATSHAVLCKGFFTVSCISSCSSAFCTLGSVIGIPFAECFVEYHRIIPSYPWLGSGGDGKFASGIVRYADERNADLLQSCDQQPSKEIYVAVLHWPIQHLLSLSKKDLCPFIVDAVGGRFAGVANSSEGFCAFSPSQITYCKRSSAMLKTVMSGGPEVSHNLRRPCTSFASETLKRAGETVKEGNRG